jgi:hypothetical protein
MAPAVVATVHYSLEHLIGKGDFNQLKHQVAGLGWGQRSPSDAEQFRATRHEAGIERLSAELPFAGKLKLTHAFWDRE